MALLNIISAPDAIFKQKATPVAEVNDNIRQVANDMLDTMYYNRAYGIGANMVGVTEQIAVVDLREKGQKNPIVLINPEIIEYSKETDLMEEGSLSFPAISAHVVRASKIKVKFLNLEGKEQILEAEGFLARVIQHEVDYLYGKVFLDHLLPLKKEMLISKMLKYIKNHPPHVHGEHCNH